MLVEPVSASLGSHLTIPSAQRIPQGYFRSKLFIGTSSTNPLIAAASPLLSLLERLCLSPTLPAIDNIRDNIEHELFAFHSRLTGQQYAYEFIAIANYILSATVDELLGKNYIRLYNQPATFKSFTPPSLDGSEPQSRFFEIVDYIKHRTNQYLDLLELAYYCLVAGFEGEQHVRADGRQKLDNLIEELYQLIQQNRVNKPYKLFKEQGNIGTDPEPVNHRPVITVALLSFSLLIACYFGSHVLLEHKAKSLLIEHTLPLKMDN